MKKITFELLSLILKDKINFLLYFDVSFKK